LLHVAGAPRDSVISIKAGSGPRRCAPLDSDVGSACSGSKPFRFKTRQAGETSLQIDVLQQAGSQRLVLKPQAGTYNVNFGAELSTTIVVKDASTAPPPAKEASKTQALGGYALAQNGHNVGTSRSEVVRAKDYLESQGLLLIMKALIEGIVHEQPDDPYAFAADQLAATAKARVTPTSGAAQQEVAFGFAGAPQQPTPAKAFDADVPQRSIPNTTINSDVRIGDGARSGINDRHGGSDAQFGDDAQIGTATALASTGATRVEGNASTSTVSEHFHRIGDVSSCGNLDDGATDVHVSPSDDRGVMVPRGTSESAAPEALAEAEELGRREVFEVEAQKASEKSDPDGIANRAEEVARPEVEMTKEPDRIAERPDEVARPVVEMTKVPDRIADRPEEVARQGVEMKYGHAVEVAETGERNGDDARRVDGAPGEGEGVITPCGARAQVAESDTRREDEVSFHRPSGSTVASDARGPCTVADGADPMVEAASLDVPRPPDAVEAVAAPRPAQAEPPKAEDAPRPPDTDEAVAAAEPVQVEPPFAKVAIVATLAPSIEVVQPQNDGDTSDVAAPLGDTGGGAMVLPERGEESAAPGLTCRKKPAVTIVIPEEEQSPERGCMPVGTSAKSSSPSDRDDNLLTVSERSHDICSESGKSETSSVTSAKRRGLLSTILETPQRVANWATEKASNALRKSPINSRGP